MPGHVDTALLQLLAAEPAELARATDADLLRRYADAGDEAAFAALVRRHAGMVVATCRRVLGQAQDAEDACQATFLLLARKARAGRWRASLAGWLYATARQVALNARRRKDRRAHHESRADVRAVPQLLDQVTAAELLAMLDEELARLPERYRIPLVLCCLEGLTRDEAACRLQVPPATLKSQLERGRRMLSSALERRGVTLGAGLLALTMASPAEAASPGLVGSVVRATAEGASPAVAALVEEVAVRNWAKQLAWVVAAVTLVGGLCAAPLLRSERETAARVAMAATRFAPPPAAKAVPRDGAIVFTRVLDPSEGAEKLARLVNPEGKAIGGVRLGEWRNAWTPRVSPDGKRVAVLRQCPMEVGTSGVKWLPHELHVIDLDAKAPSAAPLLTALCCTSFAWSRDGRSLYVSSIPQEKRRVAENVDCVVPVTTRLVDLATGKWKALDVPEGYGVVDVSPDGKSVLTTRVTWDPNVERIVNAVVPLDAPKPALLNEEGLNEARFSPDGKRILGVRSPWCASKNGGLFVVDLATKKEERVRLPREMEKVYVDRACWSPSGKRILVQWQGEVGRPPAGKIPVGGPGMPNDKWYATRVSAVEANGSRATPVATFEYGETVSGIDWQAEPGASR